MPGRLQTRKLLPSLAVCSLLCSLALFVELCSFASRSFVGQAVSSPRGEWGALRAALKRRALQAELDEEPPKEEEELSMEEKRLRFLRGREEKRLEAKGSNFAEFAGAFALVLALVAVVTSVTGARPP
ncbi:unnamed protein product [Polarella glacialis]|uniref:Transmembrane protein n=1 Tax=Polarella glacialis TaxID=89957 RepID=A0A813IKU7_POLGL|nr:unnamed protein product [Polarella glacialis]